MSCHFLLTYACHLLTYCRLVFHRSPCQFESAECHGGTTYESSAECSATGKLFPIEPFSSKGIGNARNESASLRSFQYRRRRSSTKSQEERLLESFQTEQVMMINDKAAAAQHDLIDRDRFFNQPLIAFTTMVVTDRLNFHAID